jgi:hypothetical protein
MKTIIKGTGGEFTVQLEDDGTLDTVLRVCVGEGHYVRFSDTSDYRSPETGELTPEGFQELAAFAVDDYLSTLE